MSAWQAAVSSTRKAAMEAVSIPSDGRHQDDMDRSGLLGVHESLHPRPRPPNTDRERKPE